jgi:hypothetical protein
MTGTGLAVVRPVSQSGTEAARVEPIAPTFAVRIERQADFLAHLIATREALPQTRARRRAEPAEAVSAYGRSAKTGTSGGLLHISV